MGGAGGHMWHPFDCPDVNSGQDLINFFRKSIEWAKTNKPALKIDGVNLSFRVRKNPSMPTGYEFVVDRSSMKDLDVQGVTADNANQRFVSKPFDPEENEEGEFECPEGAEVVYVGLDNKMMCLKEHGMVAATRILLPIFNDALPDIMEELQQLGMLDDLGPYGKYFNTEFVLKQINVKEYAFDFIAIHSINDFVKKGPKSRMGVETDYDQAILNRLKDKVKPHALKKEFRVYTSITTDTVRDVALEKALNENFTIVYSSQMRDPEEPGELGIGEGSTKPIKAWLADVSENPLKKPILISDGMIEKYPKMNKKQFAMAKNIYIEVLKGTAVNEIVDSPEFIEPVVDGVVIWHATRQLGNAVLDSLESEEFGAAKDQEGVVIKDKNICGGTRFKFTGDFIVGGLASDFQEQKFRQGRLLESFMVEAEDVQQEKSKYVILIPGGFKPPTGGHYSLISQYDKNPDVIRVFVVTGHEERDDITYQQSKKIFSLYGGFSNKVEFLESPVEDGGPMKTCFKMLEINPEENIRRPIRYPEISEKYSKYVFALGAGNKGGDPARIKGFANYFIDNPEKTYLNIKTAFYEPAEALVVDGEAASASRMRKAFADGDWELFKKLLPNEAHYEHVVKVLEDQADQPGGEVDTDFLAKESLFSLVDEMLEEASNRQLEKFHEEVGNSEKAKQLVSQIDIESAIDMLIKNFANSLSLGPEQIKDLKPQLVDMIVNLLIPQVETSMQDRQGAIESLEEISVVSSISGYSGGLGEEEASIIRR